MIMIDDATLSGSSFFFEQDFKTYYCAKFNKVECTNMSDAGNAVLYFRYILEELGTILTGAWVNYYFKHISSRV
jgi:hypothetical protein